MHTLVRSYGNLAVINRLAILSGNRIFFITSRGKAVSLLSDKAIIDRSEQIETLHQTRVGMVNL